MDIDRMNKDRLLQDFTKSYDILTTYNDNIEGFDKALDMGQNVKNSYPEFMNRFEHLVGKYIKDNRELAAMALAVTAQLSKQVIPNKV